MAQKIYSSVLAILFFLSFNALETIGQVEFRVELLPDNVTYRIYMKPDLTWNPPFNITSSAQVTLKTPTGGFSIANTSALVPGTNWAQNASYVAPNEDPAHDYFSFGMLSLGTTAYSYQAGVEVAIIEFENVGTCTGGVFLMEANDPFLPPNSQNANVGNQITILGAGSGNAWTANYNAGQANCSGSAPTCSVDNVAFGNPSDCGASDGSITVTASASSGTLEYSIDNGGSWQSSNTFTGLGQGSYTVLSRVQGGACSSAFANNPLTLSDPAAPTISSVTPADPSDCGTADGSISVTASGGAGNFEYQLNNNGWGSTSVFGSLSSGSYTVSVRNDDGTCEVSQNVTLNAPSAPSISSVSSSNPSACGISDGEITINASGGNGALEYSLNGTDWSADGTFDNLGGGTYGAFVRNSNATCPVQGSAVVLTAPSSLSVSVTSADPSACGLSDGSINVQSTGGTGSYEYSIDNGGNWQSSGFFQNLGEGTFTVLSRNDDSSCSTASAENPIALTEPACPGNCTIEYELELLSDGVYQVSLIPNVTWNAPQNITSTAQVTILAPAGGFVVSNLMNLIPNVTFEHNATYSTPAENLNADYFVFGLTSQGTSGITYQDGMKVPLFTFTNGGDCTSGDVSLMSVDDDPFLPPNSQNANIGQQLTTLGSGSDADICIAGSAVECTVPSNACQVEYVLETLPNGKYQVSVLPDVTWNFPENVTSTAQVTVVSSTGNFIVSNLENLIPGVTFQNNAMYAAPNESPSNDYFVFGLTSTGTSSISYQQGVKVPLFTFENGGFCTGDSVYLMQNNDPFLPPNTQSANVGQQLTTLGSGQDGTVCVSENGVACVSPYVDESCLLSYQLELLPDGRYQVSMIPDTTWNYPQSITSTAQVTIVSPSGSLVVDDLTNLIPGVVFENNANYNAPSENTEKDYSLFGLTSNGTSDIPYVQGQKVPLFTFRNSGGCTGDSIYLMPIEGDPFEYPNSQNANVGQQLTTLGSGQDANICIIGQGALCVPCGPGLADTDGDGICDNQEIVDGSDPLDPCDPDLFSPACDFVCPEYFDGDTMIWLVDLGPAEICVDVPFSEVGFYDIVVNQAPYAQPSTYCSLDTLTFYSYAFTVGQGNTGPYEVVSWEVDGNEYSGFIPTMDALADSMNVWDPIGNWVNTSNFSSVSGGLNGMNYGNMIIKHLGTGVNTYIQSNITFVGTDSQIDVDGVGEHELVITDPNGCSDTLLVIIYGPENDTLDISYPADSSYLDICLETTELPQGVSYTTSICGEPMNGTVELMGENCIQYITDPEYNGFDTICVVVCSDTDPEICDTTLVALNVTQHVCNDIFPVDSIYLIGENGEATYCAPLPTSTLATYDIILDQANYTLPTTACEYDTLIFYTYSFTVGQGNDGPYEVISWNANGNIYSGTFANMYDLVDQMNIWDPSGNWQNMGAFSAITGGGDSGNYGQMQLRHIASGVPTTIQANYTVVGTHTELIINGMGWHELVVTDVETGCSDTLMIFVAEPTPETITEILPGGETVIEICLETNELPGTPASIAFCGQPDNGAVAATSYTCVNYFPDAGFVGEDQFCVVICDDSPPQGPFCDTTYVNVIVMPETDVVEVEINPVDPTEVCLDDALDFPGNPVSASVCGENPAEVEVEVGAGTCVTLDPADDFVGDAEVCVVHCFASPISGTIVCDTTYIDIFVLPKTDTIYVEITDFDPLDTCLTDLIGLPGTLTTASICGENLDEVDAEITSLECVSLSQVYGFMEGTSEICVIHCDDRIPAVCDTTYIIVEVDIVCPEIFSEDTIYLTSPEVCVPISLSEIDAYDIVVNGEPYIYPPAPCAEDIITFYSYAFTFGSGGSGPYEVMSWNVDGNVYSGTVQDMDDLVAHMNAWDSNGTWEHESGSLSVSNFTSGEDALSIYGNMIIEHIGSGVSTTLVPNFTSIAAGSEVSMPSPGLHELVVIDEENFCSDTLYVWVVDVTPETIIEVTENGTPTGPICPDVSGLPGNLSFSFCLAPMNGTIDQAGANCAEYTPNNGFAGLDKFCVVVCSDILTLTGEPICDTTWVQVIVLPSPDVVDEEISIGEEVEICLDAALELAGPILSSGVCGANTDEVNVVTDNSTCITVEAADDFVGLTEICVYHCYDFDGYTVCDTTHVNLTVLPTTDTVYVDVEGFDPFDVCLFGEGVLNISGTLSSAFVCGENVNEVDATVGGDDCVTLDPAHLFLGTSEICVVHCGDGTPAICDTTIIVVNVAYPCEDIWMEDTIVVNGGVSGNAFCIPIEQSGIGIYEILVNGAEYTFPPEACDEDSLVYYTYSFTIGAGEAGPYDVSWFLNGTNHMTTVEDMDELATWMNQIDGLGTWYNDAQTKSVSNPNSYFGYGLMTVTQVSSGIPAILQSNFTAVAYGSQIYFDEPGLIEVVVIHSGTGCTDTIYVWYVDNAPETVTMTTPNGTPTSEYCLDAEGLPGEISNVSLCSAPQNGIAIFDGNCFSYQPDGFFTGLEEFCVVVCDDTPGPWGPFCDTTYFQINVEEPDCDPLFGQSTFEISAEPGENHGTFCTDISLSDFDLYGILVNGAPYASTAAACFNETQVSYAYSFTVGSGLAGPYEVTLWNVNGLNHSTTVQDMDELADWMNQVDPAGAWQNDEASFIVYGQVNGGTQYGNMVVNHVGTQIPSTLLPNFTEIASGSSLSLPMGTNELVFTNLENGCVDEVTVIVGESSQQVVVASRAFLQGAYTSGMMHDMLRENGYLPMEEPYTDYNPIPGVYSFMHTTGGGETTTSGVMNETGADAIVDWVFLELRDADTPTEVVATRSALIQRDGDIVDVDGFSPVTFPVAEDEYYFTVRHRSHLGIMTAEALYLSDAVTSIDFTDSNTATWGSNARRDMNDGFMAMTAGDANANGNLAFQGANNDPDAVFFTVLLAPGNTDASRDYVVQGYHHSDTNMDGQVIYQGSNNDIDFMIFFNVLQNPDNPQVLINKVISEKLP